MADTMTLPLEGKNALSFRDGVQTLKAQRAKDAEQDNKNEETEAIEEEVEASVQEEPELTEEEAEQEIEQEVTEEITDEEIVEDEPETEAEVEEETEGILLHLDDGTPLDADEIKKGFLRQSDYTRKTQHLAEARKEAMSQYTDRMKELDHAIKLIEPEAIPDWEKIAQQDPNNWARRKLSFDNKRAKQQQAIATFDKMQNDIIVEQKQKSLADLQTGVYKTSWKNNENFLEDMRQTSDFATNKLGFSDEELKRIIDPRAIIAMDMAREFAEGKKKIQTANKKVVNKPKVIKGKPKLAQKQARSNSISQTKARLSKTGSMADALAYMKMTRQRRA
mgnify:CR=1 FL=1|tara:strand:+ start:4470 stop:5474 length:1005 start_codon:yes stop_codon:yes gene_type:complete